MPEPRTAQPTNQPAQVADTTSEREPRRRTSIALSLSVLERAKVQALRERRSVADLIESALRQYLDGR
jgi:hypothetical protein